MWKRHEGSPPKFMLDHYLHVSTASEHISHSERHRDGPWRAEGNGGETVRQQKTVCVRTTYNRAGSGPVR